MTTAAPPKTAKPAGGQAGGLAGMFKNKKALAIAAGALLVLLFIMRSQSSSSSSTTTPDPNAVDPATGLTYGAEQQAALAAQQQSSTDTSGASGGDTSVTTPTGDQIPVTAGGISVAAALEGLATGLGSLQTQQANDEATAQSATDAAAQTAQAYSELNTLSSTVANSLGSLVGYITTTKSGGGSSTPPAINVNVTVPPAGDNSGDGSSPPPASTPAPVTTVSSITQATDPAKSYVIPVGAATPPAQVAATKTVPGTTSNADAVKRSGSLH